MANSDDDNLVYATHDEVEDGKDSDYSRNALYFVVGYSHHDAQEVGATDSAFDGTLEVGYRLRRPHGLLKAGTIYMTSWWSRRD